MLLPHPGLRNTIDIKAQEQNKTPNPLLDTIHAKEDQLDSLR